MALIPPPPQKKNQIGRSERIRTTRLIQKYGYYRKLPNFRWHRFNLLQLSDLYVGGKITFVSN